MSRFIDLTGQKFNRLLVIENIGKNKWNNYKWLCQCDCGNKTVVITSELKSGHTKSCGCLVKEVHLITHVKHGHTQNGKISKTYRSWSEIIRRCTNPKCTAYKNYGGRGITVCERWRNSFENFLEDMRKCPSGYSIDRIDNNGNYCKENCRWATREQQNRNSRHNHLITFDGKTQCLSAWAEEIGITMITLWNRIVRSKWPIEKALTTPVGERRKKK